MFLYLTQRLIYPLHNKLINRVAVGLKLYVAFLSVEWELFKVHLTRNIKIDCFRVSNFAVIIDSETRILQYNISTSTSNPFLCAADFSLRHKSC